MTTKPTHMLLITKTAVFVKEREFFESQRGHLDDWGKNWEPCTASSLEEARQLGNQLRKQRFPDSGPCI